MVAFSTLELAEAVGEILAETPVAQSIVPAVVKQKAVHGHAAPADQRLAELIDALECLGLRVGIEEADVEPGVVMQIGA